MKHVLEYDRIRVLWFLGDYKNARFVQILEAFESDEKSFAKVTKRLVEGAKCLDQDSNFYTVMNDLWNNYLKPNEEGGDVHLQFDEKRLAELNLERNAPLLAFALLEMIVHLPPASQQQVIGAIGRFAVTGQPLVMQVANSFVCMRAAGGRVVSYGLIACHLAWEAFKSIRSWWKGEISGARCAKNIVDSMVTVLAGAAGGLGAAFVGNMILPGAGGIIGGMIGGVVSANVASSVSDWITRKIFNLPKEVALENAFRFFDLPPNSSNDAINSKYRELALKFHPDKGGKRDDWEKLQIALAIIKVSRETDEQSCQSKSQITPVICE